MSDFEKNYLRAGAVRLVNVVISYRFEHLFFQTYFMQGELVEAGAIKLSIFLFPPQREDFVTLNSII